jgi:hypothetical protein
MGRTWRATTISEPEITEVSSSARIESEKEATLCQLKQGERSLFYASSRLPAGASPQDIRVTGLSECVY